MTKKNKKSDKKKFFKAKKNDNKVRTGQLLAPFGIGQIHNFPNDVSIMTGGLNLWEKGFEARKIQADGTHIKFDKSEFEVFESRLIKRLGINKLYKPYAWKEKDSKRNSLIPILGVRFPLWFYCRICGQMKKYTLLGHQEIFNCDQIHNGNICKGVMIPVRFVAICPQGHIEDVPFENWVHNGPPDQSSQHFLKYSESGGAGDLSNILIKCSCSTNRSLSGITNDVALSNINYTCNGQKPWLGTLEPDSSCGEKLQVVLKGASNVHYSKLVSSIYIPDEDDNIEKSKEIVNRIGMDRLKDKYNLDRDNLISLKMFIEDRDEVIRGEVASDILLNYVVSLLEPKSDASSENDENIAYRYIEFKKFVSGNVDHKELFTKRLFDFKNYINPDILSENFESIVLMEKMRETIAFTGFTRIKPENNLNQIERIAMLSDSNVDWLPANVVHGEGLFFQLKFDKIQSWRDSNTGNNSFFRIISNFHNYQRELNPSYQDRDIDPVFLIIHTFAHLLIKRLCYNCGYGSSSLKERIYFSNQEDTKMYGFLIYTAAADSEGSLGGLVNQGRENFLSKNITEALDDAGWCSADPVCMEVGRSNGQGPGSVNGAACHNCSIVSETSCEEFNLLLDRAAVIGTIDNPEIGFFNFNK